MSYKPLAELKNKITSKVGNEKNPVLLADYLRKYNIPAIGINPFPRLSFPENQNKQSEHLKKYEFNVTNLFINLNNFGLARLFFLDFERGMREANQLFSQHNLRFVPVKSHIYTLEYGLFCDPSGKSSQSVLEDITRLLKTPMPKIPEAVFVFGQPEHHVRKAVDDMKNLISRSGLRTFPVLFNKNFILKATSDIETI